MEYALIGCGVFYFLKKKKYISIQKFKNIKFVNYTIRHFKSISDKENLSNDLIKKMSSYEYQVDKYKSNYIYNKAYNVVQFKSVTDINDLKIYTDADEYGGDSVADVSYNIKDDALIITGHLEMKSKHLIEYDKMFVKVVFDNLPIKYFEKINLIRICVKTNGHVVKLLLAEDIAKINIEYYKAYVLDKSSEFRTYEVIKTKINLLNLDSSIKFQTSE